MNREGRTLYYLEVIVQTEVGVTEVDFVTLTLVGMNRG